MKKKLSTEPYKGVRDFYPEDQFIQNYIFDVWRAVVESFGYEEYNASILEPTELYASKTNEEIVNEQTYTFTDRGDRSVTLRPEMTPTVARMVAQKYRDLSFPLRWYSIANFFRYERPQRGRLREHWQLNADIFGVRAIDADVEIIRIAQEIMRTFGATEKDFVVKINNRGALLAHLIKKGMSQVEAEQELSRMDKGMSKMSDTPKAKEIDTLLSLLKDKGIKNVKYAPDLVRGFSYYTGIVFEVFDTDEKNTRSLFGGGRYDGLGEKFNTIKESFPAIGFGMGDVRIRDFLEVHKLLPEYSSLTDLYLCVVDQNYKDIAESLADYLRKEGLNVSLDMSEKKIGEQVKTASRKKVPFVVCVGKEEHDSKMFTIKELKTGKETKLKKNEITAFLTKMANAVS